MPHNGQIGRASGKMPMKLNPTGYDLVSMAR